MKNKSLLILIALTLLLAPSANAAKSQIADKLVKGIDWLGMGPILFPVWWLYIYETDSPWPRQNARSRYKQHQTP